MIKVVSFDLDDTLSDSNFDTLIWDIEIPKVYAKEKGLSLEEAKKIVIGEYDELWGKIKGDWRDASFWLKHFGLKTTWRDLLDMVKHEIKHFPEVKEVLRFLKEKGIKLIIVTSAEKKFLKAKVECEDIESFFDKTYSAPSDFNKDKKDKEVYEKVLEDFDIKANELLHVGDHKDTDFLLPKSLGIKAVLIDRNDKEGDSIKNLEELKKFLE